MAPGVNFINLSVQCAMVPAESKLHKRCSSVPPTILLQFCCTLKATAYAPSAIFWHNFCQMMLTLKLSAQELLSFGTEIFDEIDTCLLKLVPIISYLIQYNTYIF